MIIIEVFERGATPRHPPTGPTIIRKAGHLMTVSQSRKSARRARCRSIGNVSTLDDAVAALNPTERRRGKTIIRVRP
jgi:hypothetical protein